MLLFTTANKMFTYFCNSLKQLIGANGETNINKRCRLQLFKPPHTKKHYLHKEQVEKFEHC